MPSNSSATTRWLFIWLLLIEAAALICLIPSSYTTEVINSEYQLLKSSIGETEANEIHRVAKQRYVSQIVETGILNSIKTHLLPDADDIQLNGTGWWFDYVSSRITAMANMYYHFLARYGLVEKWLPFFLIIFLASIYDGITTWRIKRTNFSYTSPFLHTYSIKIIAFLIFSIVGLFLIPIVLSPSLIPATFLIASALIGLFVGNFQKRI